MASHAAQCPAVNSFSLLCNRFEVPLQEGLTGLTPPSTQTTCNLTSGNTFSLGCVKLPRLSQISKECSPAHGQSLLRIKVPCNCWMPSHECFALSWVGLLAVWVSYCFIRECHQTYIVHRIASAFSLTGSMDLEVITMQVVKLQRSWVETSPHRLVLLHPGSMPWPWSAIPKEVRLV